MQSLNLTDTIAAIATSVGESGIGIVRISGKDALGVAERVFKAKDGRKPSSYKTYTVHYGWIVSRQETEDRKQKTEVQEKVIDEVILTVMRAPKSYTREDVVEISCHGGIVALRNVLDLVLENGARLAGAGEFTRRAFLNGRIDLAQAEAVLDIIRAKTDAALKIAQEQLGGFFSQKINAISRRILEVLAVLEAGIDFPEEEDVVFDLRQPRDALQNIDNELKEVLSAARQGRILREGIHAVICGRPNVGKSSLLNALLKKERCIVTAVAGTTRDIIEEVIDIKGIPVRIVDTAGLIEPRDLVEKKAVSLAKKQMQAADLVILVFDGTKKISKEDAVLMARLRMRPVIAVINKSDLTQGIDKERIAAVFSRVLEISAKKLINIHLLEEAVADLVFRGKVLFPQPAAAANLRQAHVIQEAQKLIARSLNSLDNKLSLEFAAQDIKDALGRLDEISGKKFSEGLLDRIFSDFCIGK